MENKEITNALVTFFVYRNNDGIPGFVYIPAFQLCSQSQSLCNTMSDMLQCTVRPSVNADS